MLLIVTKCRLIFISLLLLLSVVAAGNKDAIQDLMAVATPNAMKTATSLSTPPEALTETAILLSEIAIPRTETLVPTSELTNVVEPILTTQVSFTTTVVITPTAISHELNGVGVHMFDNDYRDPKFEDALDTLGLKYLRVPFGPNWDDEKIPEPPACNDGEDRLPMYNFIKQNFNGDFPTRLENAKAISGIAEGRNIEIIFLNWRAHKTWLTDPTYKELKEDYVDDYACFVTQVFKFLTDEGVKISYLEPTNEPSDTTDTKIPPVRYNTFVTLLRKYLDEDVLSEVKISGPGLAYLNHDDTCRIYVEALDDDGVDAISVWAFHAWDPEFFPNEPEEDILRMKWEECQKAIKKREGSDPPKPFFITEYACVNVNENDPRNRICAVKNTLTLLDLGTNVAVYWYLREQGWDLDWENRERALLTENYAEKPTFTALASVLPFISGDEVGVLETQIEGRITAASFYKADNELGEKQIIVVLVNSYPESENVLIYINGSSMIDNIADRVLYDSETNTIQDPGPVPCQAAQCQLSLPPNTITTLIFRYWTLYLPIIIKSS